MRKRLLLNVLLLIACAPVVIGQIKLERGTIVLNGGDTIRTSIENLDWRISPTSISHQIKPGSREILDIEDIEYIELHESNTRYRVADVTIDKTPESVDFQRQSPNAYLVTQTALLRIIIEGAVSLYQYRDHKNHFFIQAKGDQIRELILQQTLDNRSNSTMLRTTEKYKYLLSSILQDCRDISPAIHGTRFTEKALKKVILQYYECRSLSPTFVLSDPVRKKDNGLVLGVANAKITFRDQSSASITPAIGFYFNRIQDGGHGAVSSYNEFVLTGHSKTFNLVESNSANQSQTTYHYETGMLWIKYNGALRYQLPLHKVQPFAQAGIMLAGAVLRKNKSEATVIAPGYFWHDSEDKPISRWGAGLHASIGVKTDRIALQVRYEKAATHNVYDGIWLLLTVNMHK